MSPDPSFAINYKQAQASHHRNILRQLGTQAASTIQAASIIQASFTTQATSKPQVSSTTPTRTPPPPTSSTSSSTCGATLPSLVDHEAGDSQTSSAGTSLSSSSPPFDMSYPTYVDTGLNMNNPHPGYDRHDQKSFLPSSYTYNAGYQDPSYMNFNTWQSPFALNNVFDGTKSMTGLVVETPKGIDTSQLMSLDPSTYAPWPHIQPQQLHAVVKTEFVEPAFVEYPASPLECVTSPELDSSAKPQSTSNPSRIRSQSTDSSASVECSDEHSEINYHSHSYDNHDGALTSPRNSNNAGPDKRQSGNSKQVGLNGKVKRGERRKMQNRLAQRAFRARTKVHHAEVDQEIAHLRALTDAQAARLDTLTQLVERLQKENTMLKTQRWTQALSNVQAQAQAGVETAKNAPPG